MLDLFEPVVRDYFSANFDTPTSVQRASWPVIARGEHALITAPTGSGKTLTAFLWALNKYASGELQPGVTSVLYISPLKALNTDIRTNLLDPLTALQAAGKNFPDLSVQTRSGDTPQNERQRMLRRPPELLITTPESLSLLLTSVRGRQMLSHIDTVILDEVHSIVNNRRGVQLLVALERLCWMGIDPQRIALSATVKPLQAVARQVAGFTAPGQRRAIQTIRADQSKAIDFRVKLPDGALDVAADGQKIWEPLTDAFKERLQANRSTLFFTNSRRLAEKITLKLNQDTTAPLAYAHHGSLAKDIRHAVEQKLKAGELRAIVATSSLEMGIDIGSLDEVVLIQSPPSVSAALQRIGRSGHQVGETSIGTLFPTHAHDFLQAAALGAAINARDIEPLEVTRNPLDLLAQLIIAMAASEDWNVDELFQMICLAAPYHDLSRTHYDSVVEMLAGRYSGMRLRELAPRITFDRLANRIRATRGAVMTYYSSGGTIPDRGYFKLRHAGSGQVIGELDEEFVWEATIGDTFNLGSGHWQIQRITHNDVLVNPAPANVMAPPFWRSESVNRDYHFSTYIAAVLDDAERALHQNQADAFTNKLTSSHGFDEPAAKALLDYLQRQREHSGKLPGTRQLLLEQVNTGPAGYRSSGGERQLIIHTFWGARINRPFGLALGNAWREHFGAPPQLQADNDALIIQLTQDTDPDEVMALVTRENLRSHLREALEDSDFFGARFRECAGRALLLTRKKFNQRLPLWMTRLQSKKLLAATKPLTDFPILLEAWRTCLEDEFDLTNLERLLEELQDGEITWRFTNSASPSPFAANLSWGQINQYMYADDTPDARGRSNLQDDLIASAFAEHPSVSLAVVHEFLDKRMRRHPDYAPEDAQDWYEWVKERVLLRPDELPEEFHPQVTGPTTNPLIELRSDERCWIAHAENAWALCTAFDLTASTATRLQEREDLRDTVTFTQELLSYHGPLTQTELSALLPPKALPQLSSAEYLISGQLIKDDAQERFCDVDNFEILLRFQRRANRPTIEPLPITRWPGWQAHWHNAGAATADFALEQLRGFSAPVTTWLNELLPPRLATNLTSKATDSSSAQNALAKAFVDQDLGWIGTGPERIAIDYAENLSNHSDRPATLETLFVDKKARYAFTQLLDTSGANAEDFNTSLWQAAWQGQLTSDSLDTLNVGERAAYKLSGHSSSRRARRVSWPGAWSLIEQADRQQDPLEVLETNKQIARVLLGRYGVLCRELANREGAQYKWRTLFSALRVMELAGEVVSGAFFEAFSGPQFATPSAVSEFSATWTPRDLFISVLDPISPSGMSLPWPGQDLGLGVPHRRAGNHIAIVAGEVALFSENNGKRLRFLSEPHDPTTQKSSELLRQLGRVTTRIALGEINGESARKSAYLKALETHFDVHSDHKGVYLEIPE